MNLYGTLGVAKDASKEAIKKAFRSKAKGAHPDAGGDVETFHALTLAYDVLYDDKARARYDETGETEKQIDRTEQEAMSIIGAFVDRFLADDRAVYKDFAKEFNKAVREEITIAKRNIEDGRKFELHTIDVSKRVKGKRGADLIQSMISTKLRDAANAIRALEYQVEVRELALKLVGDVEFDVKAEDRSDFYRRSQDALHEQIMRQASYGASTSNFFR